MSKHIRENLTKLFLIIFSSTFFSCVHKDKQTASLALPAVNIVADTTLDKLFEKKLTALDFKDDSKDVVEDYKKIQSEFKSKDLSFLADFKFDRSTSTEIEEKESEKRTAKKLKKEILDRKFSEFAKITVPGALKLARSLSAEQLKEVGADLAKDTTCYRSSLYVGLAAIAENYLPQPEYRDLAVNLYSHAYKCSNDEVTIRGAYRLGLLYVADGKCAEASPVLEKAGKSDGSKFLQSRALYWKQKCDGKNTPSFFSGESEDDLYFRYPLSFHGVYSKLQSGKSPKEVVESNPEPGVQFRSSDVEYNRALIVAELAIRDKNEELARRVLVRIANKWAGHDHDVLTNEQKIYLGYLLYLVDQNLDSFKLYARVLSQNPRYKSLTALKIFYPNKFSEFITASAKEHGLDPYLVMALTRQESAFNSAARSRVGARGLMQLMPATARHLVGRAKSNKLFDPQVNVEVGTLYLAQIFKRFDGNILLGLASYNAGPQVVESWVTRYRVEDHLLFMDLMPFRETREYVASILRNYYWYKALYENQNLKFNGLLTQR